MMTENPHGLGIFYAENSVFAHSMGTDVSFRLTPFTSHTDSDPSLSLTPYLSYAVCFCNFIESGLFRWLA